MLLSRLSRALRRIEIALAASVVALLLLLMLANVFSRLIGHPLIWTDELAVHLMVWLAFLGASLGVATRSHMAIGLLPESLSPGPRARLVLAVDLLVLVFLIAMAALVWRWLDPTGLWRAGSGEALAQTTFNFVYTDPTLTLGVRKVWFWLILPATCVTSLIHALAILCHDLRHARLPGTQTA